MELIELLDRVRHSNQMIPFNAVIRMNGHLLKFWRKKLSRCVLLTPDRCFDMTGYNKRVKETDKFVCETSRRENKTKIID